MVIEQIVLYLKENRGRYSAEQLREALLKAGYPAQDIAETIKITASNFAIPPQQQGVQTQITRNETRKVVGWIGGFLFASFFSGFMIVLALGFLMSESNTFIGRQMEPNQIFARVLALSALPLITSLWIYFRIRKRFIHFAQGLLPAIIIGGVSLIVIFIVLSSQLRGLDGAREKSRDARRVADIRQIQLALELYFDANNRAYPNELVELEPKFIPSVPHDPLSNQTYTYEKKPDGSYYLKAELEEPTNYALQNDINPRNQFYEVSDSPQQIPQPPRPASNAKLPTVTEIPHNPNLKCMDTDGGDKPYNKGTVTDVSQCIVDGVFRENCKTMFTGADYCKGPILYEYFCGIAEITGKIKAMAKGYSCENGCENGVCR